jgi:hypothetical protein
MSETPHVVWETCGQTCVKLLLVTSQLQSDQHFMFSHHVCRN